jgi:SecD/SecF fusion protein
MIAALGDDLSVQRAVEFEVAEGTAQDEGYYPVKEDATYLGEVIGREGSLIDVRDFKGGVAMVFKNLDPPQTIAEIKQRVREIRLQPGFEDYKWRKYEVFGLTEAGQGEGYSEVAMVVVDESLPYYDVSRREAWKEQVAKAELAQASEALRSEKALRKVVQFAPQIADQTRNQAVLAVAVALAAIVAYVWLRFGNMQFGLAAIVALVHDVAITLGFITLSDYFHGGTIGNFLLIRDFKIDLPMIAAMLTIIGYSLNDTIVVFDRIRENRGKSGTLNKAMINGSINQTLSRTLLTSLTTWIVVVIMYFMGGPGVHGFSYALVMGILVGTYSSIGIAAPLLYRPKVLAIVVYVMAALGLFGMSLVITSNTVALVVIGLILAFALAALVIREAKSTKDYGLIAAQG